jgi:hypothetical protein
MGLHAAAAAVAVGLVPLGVGGVDAQGLVAGGGRLWWTENGSVWTAREGGHAHRVAAGSAAGVGAWLHRGVLHVGGRRIRIARATDARYGGGRALAVRPRPDGALEVVLGGRVVSVVGGHRPYVRLGQVDARHAVWTEGRDGVYRVVLDGRPLPGANAYRHPQFGASVTPGGAVFFGRSGNDCGGATIYRYAHGATTTLLRLPSWEDFDTSWYADGALYLVAVDCHALTFHLAKLPLPKRMLGSARP